MTRPDDLIHLDEQDPRRAKKAYRYRLLSHDGGRCFFCGVLGAGTIDHLIPQVKCSTEDVPENMVACCHSCNKSKRSQNALSWYSRQRFYTEAGGHRLRDRLAQAREWVV